MTEDPIPQSKDVEKAILGEIMASKEFLESNLFRLTPEHFFTRSHRIIFESIVYLKLKEQTVDPITVSGRLKQIGVLDQVGGESYVSSCPFYPAGCIPENYFSVLDEKLNLRKILNLSQDIERWCFEGGITKDIIERIGSNVISFSKEEQSGNLLSETCDEVSAQIDRKLRGEKLLGLKTGISVWDKILGGINDERFYVLAARGGRGKTAMMEQIVEALAFNKIPVLIFQKDMSLALFILRIACRRAGISFMKYDLGNSNEYELKEIKRRVSELKDAPIYLYSPASMTAEKMCSIVKMEQKIHDIKVVFLDHILNLEVGNEYRIGLTRASSRIRESVKQTKIPHVILAQVNRDGDKNERPTPANIKEFDALYADCDAMIMLWSEQDSKDVHPADLFPMKFTVNKNRYGTEFEDDISFDRSLMKFK